MGKKKAFINKKTATVYSLVHRTAEAHDADPDMPPSDPRSLYTHFFGGEEDPSVLPVELSPDARKENLEFGFPDDGYDYLRHLRVIGSGQASLEGLRSAAAVAAADKAAQAEIAAAAAASNSKADAPAPAAEPSQSVFLKAPKPKAPAADVKLVDARRVVVRSAAEQDTGSPTAAAPGGVPQDKQLHGRLAAELAELEQLMAAAERVTDADAAAEDGMGDLLDDFVVTAAADEEGAADAGPSTATASKQASRPCTSAAAPPRSKHSSQPPADVPNPEHRDMAPSAGFHVLNDQFDHLLGAYDDSHLGDLDNDSRAAGTASLADFKDQMEEYLQEVSAAMAATTATAAAAGGSSSRGAPGLQPHSDGDSEDDEYEEYSSVDEGSGDEDVEEGCATSSSRGRQAQQQQQQLGRGQPQHHQLPFAAIPEEGSWDGSEAEQLGRASDSDEAAAAAMAARRCQNKAHRLESFENHDPEVAAATRARLAALEAAGHEVGQDSVQSVLVPVHREQWDCESVLSLRSHVSYQPGKITSEPAQSSKATGGLIKLNHKTGLPVGVVGRAAAGTNSSGSQSTALTKQLLAAAAAAAAAAEGPGSSGSGASEGDGGASVATSMYERPKGETAEDRKARKAAVKEAQRQARAAKKALKVMYTQEAVKQRRQGAAAHVGATFAIP